MKLTKNQLEIIKDMQNGNPYYFNAVTNYRPFTKFRFGYDAPMVHGKTMINLEEKKLIEPIRVNHGGIYKFELTELGKSIKNRHKWVGKSNISHCELCGCARIKYGMTIKYTLNGVDTKQAPNCI